MSLPQKSPQHSPDRCLPAECSVTQGPEGAHDSKALEEPCLSSHPQMPGTTEEAPDAGNAESPQSCGPSSIAIATSSTSEVKEGSFSEEKERITSWRGPGTENVPTDALNKAVDVLQDHMLLNYLQKGLITKEYMKNLNKEFDVQFPEIFQKASDRMAVAFGIEVKEVGPINQCYAFNLKLGLTYDGLMHGKEGIPKTGLLILVLGVIFMNGNVATEEELWRAMNLMGLYVGKEHSLFGEPRKLITYHFVKEKYLKRRQVANSDPPQFEFRWGSRAHAETTKMEVLEFLTKIEGTDPTAYPSQYEDALLDEDVRARARNLAQDLFTCMLEARSRARPSPPSNP